MAVGVTWTMVPTTIALTALRGYEDEYQRLVPVIESRPGLERALEGCTGVMLRAVGAPEPFDMAGCVKTLAFVGELGAELLGDSMIVGENAYETVIGWLGTPLATPDIAVDPSDDSYRRRFVGER